MLVPAILYKDKLEQEFQRLSYTERLMWYDGCIEVYDHEIKTEDGKYQYAIVNWIGEVIGYITFRVDWYCLCAYNFGLIRFREYRSEVMVSAILEVIRMIKSFKLHRIDFRCVSGNPAQRGYERLLPHFIGKYDISKKTFRDNIKDRQGKYHDTICYELIEQNGKEQKNDT